MNDVSNMQPVSSSTAKIVYILYLVGLVAGITSLVGVILAYVHKEESPEWLKSHYRYQIRTFWMNLAYVFLAFILAFVGIGLLLFILIYVWLIIRVVKGLKQLDLKQPVENEKTWLF